MSVTFDDINTGDVLVCPRKPYTIFGVKVIDYNNRSKGNSVGLLKELEFPIVKWLQEEFDSMGFLKIGKMKYDEFRQSLSISAEVKMDRKEVFEKVDKQVLFKYCELFESICGEGIEVFKRAVFLRASGCNMRCEYPCDTKYSYDKGQSITVENLYKKITKFPCRVLFCTGGEFLLQAKSSLNLIKLLKRDGWEIIIQTNGTIFDSSLFNYCDLISIDCKGPSAGKKNNSDERVIKQVIDLYGYNTEVQIKYLVKDSIDFKFAEKSIKRLYQSYVNFIIGPVNGIDVKPLMSQVDKSTFLKYLSNVRVGAQVHKLLWGNRKGV